jgi:hypothetical protein
MQKRVAHTAGEVGLVGKETLTGALIVGAEGAIAGSAVGAGTWKKKEGKPSHGRLQAAKTGGLIGGGIGALSGTLVGASEGVRKVKTNREFRPMIAKELKGYANKEQRDWDAQRFKDAVQRRDNERWGRDVFIEAILEGEFSHAARQLIASRGMRGRGGESFRRQAKQRMVSRAKEVGKDAATIAAYGAGSGFTGALVGASQGAGLATQGMSDMASRTAGRTIEKLPPEVSSQPRVPKGVGHIKTREALNAWAKNPKNFDSGPFGLRRGLVNVIGNDMVPAKGQEKDFTGKNAMFLPAATKEGVPVVVAPRNAASHIMRHEVGHAKDFAGQTAKEVGKIYGASPKDTFKAEVRAWRNAGVHPADPVRKVTLGSYKEGLRRQAASSKGAKVGALAGGVIGTAQGVFQGASAVAKNKRAEASASARSQAVHNRFQRRSDDARFDLAVKRRYKEAEDRKKVTEAIISRLYEYEAVAGASGQRQVGRGSALNIQRGTPGTAARPGGGGYSGGTRSGGGPGNPAAMQTGRHTPLNSARGRSISPNRGVVSPATSSMRTGMRSSSGAGGSSSMAGSVRFSSGSASGGASAFSNRRY